MALKDRIIEAFVEDPKFNQGKLAEEIGCSRRYVSMVLRDVRMTSPKRYLDKVVPPKNAKHHPESDAKTVAEMTTAEDRMQIETRGRTIRTAEGAMDYCDVDHEVWQIDKKVVNFWDSGKNRNWQVKVWLSRKSDLTAEAAMERLIERLPKFKYSTHIPYRKKKTLVPKKSNNLAIIANFDAHLGKLAWDVETGQGDYDLPISVDNYNYVAGANIEKCAMFHPDKFLYVIGQDLMHYENLEGVTPKGRNILDTDGRLSKLQDAAIDIIIHNVLKCREYAPVEIVLVQGNHDQTSSLWLAKVLRAWFRNDKFVTVDCEPKLRKARLWGKTFIGLAHQILPSKIAAAQGDFSIQFKDYWGKAEYREILFGDQHKKMMWKTGQQVTHGGVLFRQLTALSKIDYWHYENMFTDAVPGGEAFIYNKDAGCLANFTEWTYHRKG